MVTEEGGIGEAPGRNAGAFIQALLDLRDTYNRFLLDSFAADQQFKNAIASVSHTHLHIHVHVYTCTQTFTHTVHEISDIQTCDTKGTCTLVSQVCISEVCISDILYGHLHGYVHVYTMYMYMGVYVHDTNHHVVPKSMQLQTYGATCFVQVPDEA